MHLALYKLASDRKIQNEVYAEIRHHLKPGQAVDETVLENVKYLKAYLKEVFRLEVNT